MAYVAVNLDGTEIMSEDEPKRLVLKSYHIWEREYETSEGCIDLVVELPKGSIEKLIGRKLTWEDEPVELKEES